MKSNTLNSHQSLNISRLEQRSHTVVLKPLHLSLSSFRISQSQGPDINLYHHKALQLQPGERRRLQQTFSTATRKRSDVNRCTRAGRRAAGVSCLPFFKLNCDKYLQSLTEWFNSCNACTFFSLEVWINFSRIVSDSDIMWAYVDAIVRMINTLHAKTENSSSELLIPNPDYAA